MTRVENHTVKTIESLDKRLRVLIVRRDGAFTFIEEIGSNREGLTYDNWPATVQGGLYESAEHAEDEARAIVPWLKALNVDP